MKALNLLGRLAISVCNEVHDVSFGSNPKLEKLISKVQVLELIPNPEYLEDLINQTYIALKQQKQDQSVVTCAAYHWLVAEFKLRSTKETRAAIDALVSKLKPLHQSKEIESAREFSQEEMQAAMQYKRLEHPEMFNVMLPSEVEECLQLLKGKYNGILAKSVANLQAQLSNPTP